MSRLIRLASALALCVAAGLAPTAFADTFSPTTAAVGGVVTLTGQARPNSAMSGYLLCKSNCGQIGVGVAIANAQGQYSLTFKVPATAKPGPAAVAIGCDNCGNGWRQVKGLTVAGSTPATSPITGGSSAGTSVVRDIGSSSGPVSDSAVASGSRAGPSVPRDPSAPLSGNSGQQPSSTIASRPSIPATPGAIAPAVPANIDANIRTSYMDAFGRAPDSAELAWWHEQVVKNSWLNDPQQLFAQHMAYLKSSPTFQVQTAQRALQASFSAEARASSAVNAQILDTNSAVTRKAVGDLMAQQGGGGYRGLVAYFGQSAVRAVYFPQATPGPSGDSGSTTAGCQPSTTAEAVARFNTGNYWEIPGVGIIEIDSTGKYLVWNIRNGVATQQPWINTVVMPYSRMCDLPANYQPAWQLSQNAVCLHWAPSYASDGALGYFECTTNGQLNGTGVRARKLSAAVVTLITKAKQSASKVPTNQFVRDEMSGTWPIYAWGNVIRADGSEVAGQQTGCLIIQGGSVSIQHSNRQLQGPFTVKRWCSNSDDVCDAAVWINGRESADLNYIRPRDRSVTREQLIVTYETNDTYFNTREVAERTKGSENNACAVPANSDPKPVQPSPVPSPKIGCAAGKDCYSLVHNWVYDTPSLGSYYIRVAWDGSYESEYITNVSIGGRAPTRNTPAKGTWTSDGKGIQFSGLGTGTMLSGKLLVQSFLYSSYQ